MAKTRQPVGLDHATTPASDQVESARHDQSTGARTSALSGRHGIGLCLSGGGFRATLFHLGALRRMNELGILSRDDFRTVASVSGGSIAAAALATAYTRLPRRGKGPVPR